jgi:hypothetical protein
MGILLNLASGVIQVEIGGVLQADQIVGAFSAFSGLALGSGIKLQPVYGSDDVRLVGIVDAGPRIVGATPGG